MVERWDREGYEAWYLMPPLSSMVRTPTVSFENETVMPQYAAEEPQKLTPLTFPASRAMWDREGYAPGISHIRIVDPESTL